MEFGLRTTSTRQVEFIKPRGAYKWVKTASVPWVLQKLGKKQTRPKKKKTPLGKLPALQIGQLGWGKTRSLASHGTHFTVPQRLPPYKVQAYWSFITSAYSLWWANPSPPSPAFEASGGNILSLKQTSTIAGCGMARANLPIWRRSEPVETHLPDQGNQKNNGWERSLNFNMRALFVEQRKGVACTTVYGV